MYFNINLCFNGQCQQAFNFYQEILGGDKPQETILYRDIDPEINPEDGAKVFYTELQFDGFVLRGQDELLRGSFLQASNTLINLDFESQTVGTEIYQALSEQGIVIEPLEVVFPDLMYGKFVDKFEITWEIIIHLK